MGRLFGPGQHFLQKGALLRVEENQSFMTTGVFFQVKIVGKWVFLLLMNKDGPSSEHQVVAPGIWVIISPQNTILLF